MSGPPKRQRGRPRDYAEDEKGDPVVGISFHKGAQQYYLTGSKPRLYLGSDLKRAIRRFREWQAQQRGEPLRNEQVTARVTADLIRAYWRTDPDSPTRTLIELMGLSPDQMAEAERDVAFTDATQIGPSQLPWSNVDFATAVHEPIDLDGFWQRLGLFVRNNPRRFAELVGLPEVGNLEYLDDIKPPPPGPTLQELAELYKKYARTRNAEHRKNVLSFWSEFISIVGVPGIDLLQADHVRRYLDTILDRWKRRKLKVSYVTRRFKAIKAVFNTTLKKGYSPNRLTQIITLCKMLTPPDDDGEYESHPIDRKHFHALYDAANDRFKLIMLLALNCGYRAIDITRLPRSAVNLQDRCIVTRRHKNRVRQVAYLWERTAEAVREYQTADPHTHERLILNAYGNPLKTKGIQKTFKKLRTKVKAKVPADVVFEHLRDGAATYGAAEGIEPRQVQILLGQKGAGVLDRYIKRLVEMVKPVCESIEQHYFGEEPEVKKEEPKPN